MFEKKLHLGRKRLSQTQFIAGGFFIIIILGTLLLMLPFASRSGQSLAFSDALFTSTSATCVTGLVIVDTCMQFTAFGQVVILILIQIGGLGFITLGVLVAIMLRRKIGLRFRGLMSESANSLQIGGIVKLTRMIIRGTAILEASGALILSTRFVPEFGLIKGVWYGIFHSVSAFCNAGFDLMGTSHGLYSSLTAYRSDWVVNITIMTLVVTGGLGFIVWEDLLKNGFHFKRYRLQSKVVISTTAFLIFSGAILFSILEGDNAFSGFSTPGKILASFFASITPRTAGFNTTDLSHYTQAGKFLTVVFMFIGGGSGSTAGGIKVTSVFVLYACLKSNISRAHGFNGFGRRIDNATLASASAITTLNLSLVMLAVLAISGLQGFSIVDTLLETVSAISTVGLSSDLTRNLGTVSRYIIIILMYFGRMGSMSFALAFTQNKRVAHITFPFETMRVG